MEITVLIEDTKQDDRLIKEFGFSILIETDDHTVLLDTGHSNNFLHNCSISGKNINNVDLAVISHAHLDHAGGLKSFVETNKTAPVYMHTKARQNYYGNIGAKLPLTLNSFLHPLVKTSRKLSRYIGIDQEVLKNHKDRIQFVDQNIEIANNIFLISNIEKKFPTPIGNKFLLMERHGRLEQDTFDHELMLVIKEQDGIVIFSGCCHTGILNMLNKAKKEFPDDQIKAVIGGFHLKIQPQKETMAGTREDIELIARTFANYGVQKIYTGHCTGQTAYEILKTQLKEKIERLYTGLVIKF